MKVIRKIPFYKIACFIWILLILVFFDYVILNNIFFSLLITVLAYIYIAVVKNFVYKNKQYSLKSIRSYLTYLKNRFKRKFIKKWSKLIVFLLLYFNKLYSALNFFLSFIQDTKRIDYFLRRYHIHFLMRVVWFYVGFVNYTILLNYRKYLKKSVDSVIDFCKSRAFLFNVKKYKFIYFIIFSFFSIIVIIKICIFIYFNISDLLANFMFYNKAVNIDQSKSFLKKVNRQTLLKFRYKSYKNYSFLKFIDYYYLMHLVDNGIYKATYYKKNINSNLICLKFNDSNVHINAHCEEVYNKFYFIDHFLLKFYENTNYNEMWKKKNPSLFQFFVKSIDNSICDINAKNLKEPSSKNSAISYLDYNLKKRRRRRVRHGFSGKIHNVFKDQIFNFDDVRSKNVKLFYLRTQHDEVKNRFIVPCEIMYKSRRYARGRRSIIRRETPFARKLIRRARGNIYDMYSVQSYLKARNSKFKRNWKNFAFGRFNWKNLYLQTRNIDDMLYLCKRNFDIRYTKHMKFFNNEKKMPTASNFFFENRKFEQLHSYKQLNNYKFLNKNPFMSSQYYLYKEAEVYNVKQTKSYGFVFKNNDIIVDENITQKVTFDDFIYLKKVKQSKKLAAFIYRYKNTLRFNIRHADIPKVFFNSFFENNCLNTIKKRNAVNFFSVDEPFSIRKSTFFQLLIKKIRFFIYDGTIFVLSIPGKIFTFFVEDIPYKAIFSYIWWLIKGIINFSHMDNYIYGKKFKKERVEKAYFLEVCNMRKEFKNNIDYEIISKTPFNELYYDDEHRFLNRVKRLRRTYAIQYSYPHRKHAKLFAIYHPYFLREEDALADDCLFNTPHSHNTEIAKNHYAHRYRKFIKKMIRYRTYNNRVVIRPKVFIKRMKIAHELMDDKSNEIKLEKRIDRLKKLKKRKGLKP